MVLADYPGAYGPTDCEELGFRGYTDVRDWGIIAYACDAANYTFLRTVTK